MCRQDARIAASRSATICTRQHVSLAAFSKAVSLAHVVHAAACPVSPVLASRLTGVSIIFKVMSKSSVRKGRGSSDGHGCTRTT